MKKIGIIIFSIILSLLLFAVGCETTPGNRPIASSSSKPTQSQSSSSKEVSSSSQEEISSAIPPSSSVVDYGTLTIADVHVNVGDTATIITEFSKPEYQEEVSFSFEGNDVIINGTSVIGLVEGAIVTVTATTSHHSTTFKIYVDSNAGELTIADVNVEYGKVATIVPNFTTNELPITYIYDTSKISISGNTVTGLVAEAVVTVTAKTDKHETTFKVTVGKDYGTLTIANVNVEYNKTATITPNFSTSAGSSLAITYTYDTSKISISGNTVTGKVAGASVTVTAKTDKHETTFTVTVGEDYGTLTIANVSVEHNKTTTINPVFSTTAGSSLAVTYTCDTSKISISGNTVTGLVAEAVVTVTAKTDKHETTFTVTVGKDYGTLTIANVSVAYNGTATITPNFSTTAGSSLAITYTYDTSKISISGNTVTGKVAGASVTVTAKTDKHNVTFTVTVGKDYTFKVGNVTTYAGFYVIPTPTFTVPANAQSVTYTTTSSNVTISGNKITGAKENTTATVTAKTSQGTSATFTVTVGANSFFNNFNDTSNFLSYFNTVQTKLANRTDINKNDLTLYIGDSFFDYRNFFTTAFNGLYSGANADTWGISSSLTRQWIYFAQKTYALNPKNIVIHIGTNDIFDDYGPNRSNLVNSAPAGSANYNTIVNEITNRLKTLFNNYHSNLPNTKLYWYSIEPRLYNSTLGTYGNAIAEAINSNIKTFATSNSSWLTYLDSCSIFKADTSLYFDDVHPNVAGYIKMTALLPTGLVSSNTNYLGSTSNFTHNYDAYANSTIINGSYGDFVYTSNVTLNAFTKNNAHITLNFNHNSSYRFLLWDNQNSGKFWFGGIFNGGGTVNGGAGAQSYLDANATPITFKLAILSKNKVQYMFIEDQLVAVYKNNFTPICLTVGAENCNITFNDNLTGHSTSSLYTTYANKVANVTVSAVMTTYAGKNVSNSATAVADISTVLTDTAAGKSVPIVSTASTFLYTGKLNISAMNSGANCHVSLSVGNDHGSSHRFLIWDINGDGKYFFGWGPNYTNSSKGYFNFSTTKTLNIAILSTSKHSYLFVNGALQTVFASKGNCTLLYATENMATTLTSGLIYASGTKLYNSYLSAVSTYESGSYTAGQAIDVGGDVVVSGYITDFTQTSGNAVIDGCTPLPASGNFVFESTVTINSYATNGHISLSLNSSTTTTSNRFLIWDNNSDGVFNFGGAYNGTHATGSGSISATTTPKTFKVAVYVNGKKAYLFVDGALKTVLVLNFEVESFIFGAENCSVTFSGITVSNTYTKISNYNSYASKSGVSNYASSGVGLYDHTNSGNKLA